MLANCIGCVLSLIMSFTYYLDSRSGGDSYFRQPVALNPQCVVEVSNQEMNSFYYMKASSRVNALVYCMSSSRASGI
jgi:hypothetical protein